MDKPFDISGEIPRVFRETLAAYRKFGFGLSYTAFRACGMFGGGKGPA